MRQLLLEHLEKYPLMQPQDCVKLFYQSRMGCGHFLSGSSQVQARLQKEYQTCPHTGQLLFESLGHDYCRLHLSAFDASELSLETLGNLFVYSSQQPSAGENALKEDLLMFDTMVRSKEVPFALSHWESFLSQYQSAGFPAISHSDTYRQAYHPSYRVLHRICRDYWPVLAAVDQLMRKKGGGIIAIDGGSGTGKSRLASFLSAIFPAAVIHMDDFFLQGFQRTPQRLAEPGGNLDYERFADQVVCPLRAGKPFSYEIFDCTCGKLSGVRAVGDSPIRIVEGVYSLHPQWSGLFDLKIFLSADLPVRLSRIEKRSGQFLLQKFQEEWIPKEDLYFDTFSIPDQADIVVDTGTFF